MYVVSGTYFCIVLKIHKINWSVLVFETCSITFITSSQDFIFLVMREGVHLHNFNHMNAFLIIILLNHTT